MGTRSGEGYTLFAENVQQFLACGFDLPVTVGVFQLDDGSGIKETVQKNSASWHKSCREKMGKRSLERLQKKAEKRQAEDRAATCSSAKTRRSAGTPASSKDICFFCNESSGKLYSAATFGLDYKVRHAANLLQDKDLLKKLAAGDMIATDSQYHLKCLISLYNRANKYEKELNCDQSNSSVCHGIAFAELVSYIQSFEHDETTAPVFRMSKLCTLYNTRLQELGVSCSLHTTRLRQKLLDACPELQECNTGRERDATLVFKRDLGYAVSKVVDHDSDALLLAQAAKIVRREIFSKQENFNGDFLENCQENATPSSLKALVSMILDGPGNSIKTSNPSQEEAALGQK